MLVPNKFFKAFVHLILKYIRYLINCLCHRKVIKVENKWKYFMFECSSMCDFINALSTKLVEFL